MLGKLINYSIVIITKCVKWPQCKLASANVQQTIKTGSISEIARSEQVDTRTISRVQHMFAINRRSSRKLGTHSSKWIECSTLSLVHAISLTTLCQWHFLFA